MLGGNQAKQPSWRRRRSELSHLTLASFVGLALGACSASSPSGDEVKAYGQPSLKSADGPQQVGDLAKITFCTPNAGAGPQLSYNTIGASGTVKIQTGSSLTKRVVLVDPRDARILADEILCDDEGYTCDFKVDDGLLNKRFAIIGYAGMANEPNGFSVVAIGQKLYSITRASGAGYDNQEYLRLEHGQVSDDDSAPEFNAAQACTAWMQSAVEIRGRSDSRVVDGIPQSVSGDWIHDRIALRGVTAGQFEGEWKNRHLCMPLQGESLPLYFELHFGLRAEPPLTPEKLSCGTGEVSYKRAEGNAQVAGLPVLGSVSLKNIVVWEYRADQGETAPTWKANSLGNNRQDLQNRLANRQCSGGVPAADDQLGKIVGLSLRSSNAQGSTAEARTLRLTTASPNGATPNELLFTANHAGFQNDFDTPDLFSSFLGSNVNALNGAVAQLCAAQ